MSQDTSSGLTTRVASEAIGDLSCVPNSQRITCFGVILTLYRRDHKSIQSHLAQSILQKIVQSECSCLVGQEFDRSSPRKQTPRSFVRVLRDARPTKFTSPPKHCRLANAFIITLFLVLTEVQHYLQSSSLILSSSLCSHSLATMSWQGRHSTHTSISFQLR